jgi:vacuolar protein sorting-associated protein 33A
MAPVIPISTSEISQKANRDLLRLLEGVSKATPSTASSVLDTANLSQKVRGKKNIVLEKSLAGPLGLLVKFSTLQEYGVDRPFFLENDNVDSSQRNVVFLARGEKAKVVLAIAGMPLLFVPSL